jgi:hypothetical protein
MHDAPEISSRARVTEAALEADELDLILAGLLHPLCDAARGANGWTVVLVFSRAAAFRHAPSVD